MFAPAAEYTFVPSTLGRVAAIADSASLPAGAVVVGGASTVVGSRLVPTDWRGDVIIEAGSVVTLCAAPEQAAATKTITATAPRPRRALEVGWDTGLQPGRRPSASVASGCRFLPAVYTSMSSVRVVFAFRSPPTVRGMLA
jgi:hypothetical protein